MVTFSLRSNLDVTRLLNKYDNRQSTEPGAKWVALVVYNASPWPPRFCIWPHSCDQSGAFRTCCRAHLLCPLGNDTDYIRKLIIWKIYCNITSRGAHFAHLALSPCSPIFSTHAFLRETLKSWGDLGVRLLLTLCCTRFSYYSSNYLHAYMLMKCCK